MGSNVTVYTIGVHLKYTVLLPPHVSSIVTMSEVKAEFDEMLQAYIAYYAQYGYEMDEYDIEFQNSVAQETVQLKLSQKVAERHAMETGYELTQEKDEGYQAEALAALTEMMEYYTQYLLSYGVPEDEIDAVVQSELEAAGYTYDTLYESAKLKGVLDHLYALGTEGVTVTEEEVKAAFDAKVAAQKEQYDADVDAFISAYIGGEELLYTPENVRLMHCIFVALEAEEVTAPSAVLMDAGTGTVLFEKNANERLAPASVTKVMTLLLVMEALEKNNWFIRRELGRRIRNQLKIVPELQFFLDDSLEYIENIDSLLKG